MIIKNLNNNIMTPERIAFLKGLNTDELLFELIKSIENAGGAIFGTLEEINGELPEIKEEISSLKEIITSLKDDYEYVNNIEKAE